MQTPASPGKPKLRGVPDVIAVISLLPVVLTMAFQAKEGVATVAASIYGASIIMMFAVSALYHTPHWPLHVRRWWQRLDHSAIYIFIAGSYTPPCLLALPKETGYVLLLVVWGMALLGALKSFLWPHAPRALSATIYVVMGWAIVPFVPTLLESLGLVPFILFGLGGLSYTVGAVVYVKRRPNPSPRVFGYHEVFHMFVIAAAGFHLIAIWPLVA